jgi:hypothetical protein
MEGVGERCSVHGDDADRLTTSTRHIDVRRCGGTGGDHHRSTLADLKGSVVVEHRRGVGADSDVCEAVRPGGDVDAAI